MKLNYRNIALLLCSTAGLTYVISSNAKPETIHDAFVAVINVCMNGIGSRRLNECLEAKENFQNKSTNSSEGEAIRSYNLVINRYINEDFPARILAQVSQGEVNEPAASPIYKEQVHCQLLKAAYLGLGAMESLEVAKLDSAIPDFKSKNEQLEIAIEKSDSSLSGSCNHQIKG